MERLIDASLKAIGSVFAPGMFGVFVMSVLFTLAALLLFVLGVTSVVSLLVGGAVLSASWTWLSGVGATMLAYFLFPGIMPVFVNFFDSKIATLIEAQDYPNAQPINPPFWPEFRHDVRFSLMAVGLNILVLPFYLLPGINLVIFYVLNGHLLGKEFFVMVARRYLPLHEAVRLRKTHGRSVFIGGILLTVLATVPFLNLLAPFWGIALMTHLYHSLAATPKVEVLPPA
ncbi:MAG: EI24 domain-containing protein [Alphaproteobacteria bacterium]|nr:EI24 domain-containing protein [Alphaproteobacteria bacterium]